GGRLAGHISGWSGTARPQAHCSLGTSAWTGGYSVGGPFSVFGSTTSTWATRGAASGPAGLGRVGASSVGAEPKGMLSGYRPGFSGTTAPQAHCSLGTSAWTGGYSVGGPFSVFGSTTSTGATRCAASGPAGLGRVGASSVGAEPKGTLSGYRPGFS